MTVIDAAGVYYRELNQRIREAVAAGECEIEVLNVNGQRYIGDAIEEKVRIVLHGVPGNDLGAFMSGPTIIVHGNGQDGIGNTMNDGRIVVYGHAGDVIGYGMRGGTILVKGDVGYRVGIHMKAYKKQVPVIVAGGRARDFLGEYMAGGLLVLLGLEAKDDEPIVGDYCATGIHGGAIYVRGHVNEDLVSTQCASMRAATADDQSELLPALQEFCGEFDISLEEVMGVPFHRITPSSHRPYAGKYAP